MVKICVRVQKPYPCVLDVLSFFKSYHILLPTNHFCFSTYNNMFNVHYKGKNDIINKHIYLDYFIYLEKTFKAKHILYHSINLTNASILKTDMKSVNLKTKPSIVVFD